MAAKTSYYHHLFKSLLLLLGIAVLVPTGAYAQKKNKVTIKNANTFEFATIHGVEVRKLIGDVIFEQDGVIMKCDSAYHFAKRNFIEAFGDIRINRGDSIRLSGNYLEYDGNTRLALIEGDVQLSEDEMTLTTEQLSYNMREDIAFYDQGATIVDKENKLVSKEGEYWSYTKELHFRDSVKLHNPEYSMFSDTLQYNTETEVSYFYGPTTIVSDSNLIYCENGWYNTQTNKSRFGKNAYLVSEEQTLYGDSLFYDRDRGYGRARQNIRVVDTSQELTVYGQFAEYFEHQDKTYITDSVLVEKRYESDTFFLHADTLLATYDSSGEHRLIRGYYGVKTFSGSFQSKADSLAYSFRDSIIYLFGSPVFWFEEYQITGEYIQLHTNGPQINKVDVLSNAFMISKIDSSRYDQVKGKNMYGHLRNNELFKIEVIGNGQSIYYALDDDEKLIGVNEIQATDINIRIKNREISAIKFVNEPTATVHPPLSKNPEELRLKGFVPRFVERPASIEELYFP